MNSATSPTCRASTASRATVKLLNEFNCEIITPREQVCCGAPQDDRGLKDVMRKMAQQNIETFERLGDLDAIVADCAACSGFLKEYRHVCRDDPAWAGRAARFPGKVRDITEWLDQIMPEDLTRPAQPAAHYSPRSAPSGPPTRRKANELLHQGQGLVAAVDAAIAAGTLTGTPNIGVLNGSPTDNNATLFHNGYMSVIQPKFDSGEWVLAAEQSVPEWDNQQALILFDQMLIDHPEINAAIAANDGLAQSVISSLQNAGLPFIPVTGQDATVGGVQNVLAGRQSMTVYKAIRAEARAAAALAISIVTNNTPAIELLATGAVNNGTNDIPSILLVPVSL